VHVCVCACVRVLLIVHPPLSLCKEDSENLDSLHLEHL